MGIIILLCVMLIFGPPVAFLLTGLSKQNTDKETAKILYIAAAVWLLIGGGICASIMS